MTPHADTARVSLRTESGRAIAFLAVAAAVLAAVVFAVPRSWGFITFAALMLLLAGVVVRDPRRILLASLVISLPLNISKTVIEHPVHIGGAQALEVALLDIPMLALYALWIWDAVEHTGTRRSIPVVFAVSLGTFLLVATISLTQSRDSSLAVFEIWRTLRGVLVFVYVAKHVDLERDLGLILVCLMAGFAVLTSETVINQALGTSFNFSAAGRGESARLTELIGTTEVLRSGGSLGSPNALASYVALLLPLPLAMLFASIKPRFKFASLVLAALGFATLYLTMSRGAWLGMALAVAFMLIVAARRRWVSPLAAATALAGAGLAVVVANLVAGNALWLRLTASQPENVTSRYEFARIAFRIIEARPILGVGINNFTESMSSYDVTGLSQRLSVLMPVHNLYLLIAAETGMLGLIAFMVFLLAVAYESLTASGRFDDLLGWALLAVCGGLITLMTQGLVDFAFRLNATFYTFWFLTGVAVSGGITARGKLAESEDRHHGVCPRRGALVRR